MKNKYYIIILLAVLFMGCSKDVWLDNDTPKVYIPKNGLSINKAWLLESNEYIVNLSAYCSGVRPENQKTDIVVTFAVVPKLIEDYNNAVVPEEYSGKIVELPASCYSFVDDKIVIAKGTSHGDIPIKIDMLKLKALGLKTNEVKYAIPVQLQSTSMYNLQENANMLSALYCVTMDEPSFYFWDNRDVKGNVIAKKLMVNYENKNDKYDFRIVSHGLPVGQEYTLNLAVDETLIPKGGYLLPSNAYEFPATVKIEANAIDTYVPIKFVNSNVDFGKVFYLPLSIKSASKYGPDAERSVLMLKITAKNDYEWKYASKMSITAGGRTNASAGQKSFTSYSIDMVDLPIFIDYIDNDLVDNWDYDNWDYIPYSFRLKIIPTDNKNKYKVELIKLPRDAWGYRNPASLELDPEKESYFDWDYETFHLNYRYKSYDGSWINISEILEAQ
ncbi:MAG: DUF1735 domain-containing protein [Bacteroidales bacterium]